MAEQLASNSRGFMVAAAGCGKTEIIATAVAQHGAGRELILTHTNAGVDALRKRLRKFGVPRRDCAVETIASWATSLTRAFPKKSKLRNFYPGSNEEFEDAYEAAARLLGSQPIQEIVRSSYSGIYVDEYQDCTEAQHKVVQSLMSALPCRIVGDPMQAIFNFPKTPTIRWSWHVTPNFIEVEGPREGWRWKVTNPALGDWLRTVREALEKDEPIDVSRAPLRWIHAPAAGRSEPTNIQACQGAPKDGTVVAIRRWPNQCHSLARKLGGRYSCVEAVDAPDLFNSAKAFDETRGHARAVAVVEFASKIMTTVSSELKTTVSAFRSGRLPGGKKHGECKDALREVCESSSVQAIAEAIDAMLTIPGVIVFRRELRYEMMIALRAVGTNGIETISQSVSAVRGRARHRGRRLPYCSIGTTLLVKGLEFDHAVVLDAQEFDAENLYVALTRGCKTLTIVSPSPILSPIRSSYQKRGS